MTTKQPDYSTLSPSARLFAREWDKQGVPIKLRYNYRLHKPGRYDVTVDAIHPPTCVVLLNGARYHAVYEHGVVVALGYRVVLHDYMRVGDGVTKPLETSLKLALAQYLETVVCSAIEHATTRPGLQVDEVDDRIRELVRWAVVHKIA